MNAAVDFSGPILSCVSREQEICRAKIHRKIYDKRHALRIRAVLKKDAINCRFSPRPGGGVVWGGQYISFVKETLRSRSKKWIYEPWAAQASKLTL